MSIGPRTPLPAHHLLIRQEIMNGNGINFIYPLGRDYGISYPDYFESYNGSGLSMFGYIVDQVKTCELGISGSYGGLILMKTGANSKLTIVTRSDNTNSLVYTSAGNNYYNGQPFMYRFRAAYVGSIDKDCIVGYENDTLQYAQPMYIKSIRIHEYFGTVGSHVLLSVHYGDYPPSEFPLDRGLDLIIPGIVIIELGSYAVYDGIYSGSDAISIIAPGAVRDLGKPATSGVNVRIGIRKNLTMYVFVADYGSAPVAAPFAELVSGGGHAYIPRFTPNFNIRRIQIESYY